MDGLRWLLLLFGLLVIAGVYLYSRQSKKAVDNDNDALVPGRVEPRLDGGDAFDDVEVVSADAEESAPEEKTSLPDDPQKIVTVRIVAHEKKSFAGDELVLSLRGIGLRLGKFGIFHRYDGNDEARTIFSAASLVEPGSFDLQNIKGQEIPGISLFLVLPGPVDGVEGFDMMLAAARTLTQSLNGELLDESGSTMSIQRERYLREEVIQFQHSSLVS
jgi:cell division protein ZipA